MRQFLFRCLYLAVAIGSIEYTSILAEIRHHNDILGCLYWIDLPEDGCNICLSTLLRSDGALRLLVAH
jgi:hypothetical protein